jgi:hypothetical protein
MLKPLCILLSSSLSVALAANKLTPIAGTRYDHAVSAKTDLGDIVIAARETLVDVTYTDGRPRKGALMVLFDPASGRYLWEFGPVPLTDKTASHMSGYGTTAHVYVAGDRLVHFAFGHPYLMVHESPAKGNGIDDAEAKALAEATGRLPSKLTGKTDDRVIINLGMLLPREFFLACPLCSGPGPVKITAISHKGNTWEITLQGPWQEKITLNQKYAVTAIARID